MRTAIVLIAVALAIVWATATSRSDTSADDSEPAGIAEPEPITGSSSTPLPGSERPMKDPFTPYDPGPPEAHWSYDSLNSAEKQVVDRGRTEDYSAINSAYAGAAKHLSDKAKADAAATQLGTDNLDSTGVVP
jgi:hypothetical protein